MYQKFFAGKLVLWDGSAKKAIKLEFGEERRLVFLSGLLTVLLVLLAAIHCPVRSHNGVEVGYAVLQAGEGSPLPFGTALFSSENSEGILVWEAAVAAVPPIARGRIFVEQGPGKGTAVALANPSDRSVEVHLTLRDQSGGGAESRVEIFESGEQRALFVGELFPQLNESFIGSLSFETAPPDQRLAAITLRQSINPHDEAVFSTLPVADLASVKEVQSVVFPHIGSGGGLSSQLILINPTPDRVGGLIRLIASDGGPLQALVDGMPASEFPYRIEPDGVFRAEIESFGRVQVGYAVVSLEEGSRIPAGSAVFQFRQGDAIVSEAGVAAVTPTTRARFFVDNSRTRTGIALASPGNETVEVTFRLLDRFGGFLAGSSQDIPGGGHRAFFADETFPQMPEGFTGLMEIVGTAPVAPISLKLTVNIRGDPVMTTLPVADMNSFTSADLLVFPQLGFGDGLATRLIFINGDSSQDSRRRLIFFRTADGEPLDLPLGDRFGNAFELRLQAGGSLDYRPGSLAGVERIVLDTFNPQLGEVLVREGEALQLRPGVVDTEGNPRDDFAVAYSSLDEVAATVNNYGLVIGRTKGFSTLTIRSGDRSLQGLITVVRVRQAAEWRDAVGVVQDLAGRVYLSNPLQNVILRADSLDSLAEQFAGVEGYSGLQNGTRQQARFNRPNYMALDQANGDLYVSDSGNHVIRRIRVDDTVETFAGSGQPGVNDGPRGTASFKNPQGLALDSRGYLWVADCGNHAIRRIHLITGIVETVAGSPGEPGESDGGRMEARFRKPTGIGLKRDALAGFLVDEEQPILIISDSGNNRLRALYESGRVQTLKGSAADGLLSSPTGLAIDKEGRIYVAESAARRVSVFEAEGIDAPLTQMDVGSSPQGISIAQDGHVLVSGIGMRATLFEFGMPSITSVLPDTVSLRGGERILLQGRNFTPNTAVVIAGKVITDTNYMDSSTIQLETPPFDTISLQNISVISRGGIGQTSFQVLPVPLKDLQPGDITTVVGGSIFDGDGGPAISASLESPSSLAVNSAGDLYIADTDNNRVRRVQATTGIITTVAGTGETGLDRDGRPAIAASLRDIRSIAFDRAGNLLISTAGRIRRVDAHTGTITTIEGLDGVAGIAVDQDNNLFFAEISARRVSKLDAGTGTVTRIAGNGESGVDGDGGPATKAALAFPGQIAFDRNGDIYIAPALSSEEPRTIRKVDMTTGIITTVAGVVEDPVARCYTPEAGNCPLGDGGPATRARLFGPRGLAFDEEDNLYIASFSDRRVRKVEKASGLISTVAGPGCTIGEAGNCSLADGGPAATSTLNGPAGLAFDGAGNLYIADSYNYRSISRIIFSPSANRIRKVGPDGMISTVAGGRPGDPLGDGGPAIAALVRPSGLAFDTAGNLFIAQENDHRIRKVDAVTGTIATVAGNGNPGFSGDGGPAVEATLSFPTDVQTDSGGNLYIADSSNRRIRLVDSQTGAIRTLAGNGCQIELEDCDTDERLPGGDTTLGFPSAIALDEFGNLYFTEMNYIPSAITPLQVGTLANRVRKINLSTGILTTIAGSDSAFRGDGGPAEDALMTFGDLGGFDFDSEGNLYVADSYNHRIRRIDRTTGIIETIAGNGQRGFGGDDGPAVQALMTNPSSVKFDTQGNLYVSDLGNSRIRMIDAATKIITTAHLRASLDIEFDPYGDLYLINSTQIHRIHPENGDATLIAGNGQRGFSGDGGPASEAALNYSSRIAFDSFGNLYITDTNNHRVRRVDVNGLIGTVAGNGEPGFGGDGGLAIEASLNYPKGVAVDTAEDLYIADTRNNRIRRVDRRTGVISTVAGDGSRDLFGDGGDGGPATIASLDSPAGIRFDAGGDLFIAGASKSRIRRLGMTTNIISNFAGRVERTFGGDGGPADQALLSQPTDVVVGPEGDLFIADAGNLRIRKVDGTTAIISTVAGQGCFSLESGMQECELGEGGPATEANLDFPRKIAFDAAGNLYIAEEFRIWRIDAGTGIIAIVAGNGSTGFTGDGGPAAGAALQLSGGLAFSPSNDLFISATTRVRAIRFPLP